MLTLIFYSLIFTGGILAAYVDWEKFIKEATSFTLVENPVSISRKFYDEFSISLVVVDRRNIPWLNGVIFCPYIHTSLLHIS